MARASFVTLWHPDVGLAVCPVGTDGRIEGKSGPCEIVLRARRGPGDDGGAGASPVVGRVGLWPATSGPGAPFCRPAASLLDRPADATGAVVFRGLPSGFYRYDGVFRRAEGDGAGKPLQMAASFRGSVRVDPSNPRVVVEEPITE
jgi:hypothetical protein